MVCEVGGFEPILSASLSCGLYYYSDTICGDVCSPPYYGTTRTLVALAVLQLSIF